MSAVRKVVVTAGEPAGIGLDIILKAVDKGLTTPVTVVCDRQALANRAALLGVQVEINEYRRDSNSQSGLSVIHVAHKVPVVAGKLDSQNSESVIDGINHAVDLCLSGEFDAMVTAPVHKGIINDAGIPFSGHTEWIAQRCGALLPVMMLAGKRMKVCLATTHLPLSAVSRNITQESLTQILGIMHKDIGELYGLDELVIGVCGLNPHAGEGGHLGTEEIEVIEPVLTELRKTNMNLIGPLPADTAFTQSNLRNMDAVLAMYHDQGLPVIKHSDFGDVVNVTLGIPIIRTSVDHGTALDLAGSGSASETSLVSAIELAMKFASNRKAV